jgi:Flp pilus assembly protein TadD
MVSAVSSEGVSMERRFCTQCGARLLSAASFCVECGLRIGGRARAPRRQVSLERVAPALVAGAVLLVAGGAVFWGSRVAAPPAVVPPRAVEGQEALPENHPPVEIPQNVRDALAKLAEAAKAKPNDVDTWKQLGFAQYRAGQVDRSYLAPAGDTYRHVLELAPNDLDALRALGNISFDRDASDEAIGYYQRYLTVKPDDLSVLTDLGTMHLSARRPEKAIEIYRGVLQTDPKFFQAQFNIAIALRAMGQSDAALDALRRAREIASDDASRQRVDEILSRLTGEKPADVAGAGQAPAPRAAPPGIQGDIEAIFRSHPIVGPKLDRIEWPDPQTAKVLLRQFPMEGMPPMVRQKFLDRIRTGLKEKKSQYGVQGPMRVELVDAETGRVMETVSE